MKPHFVLSTETDSLRFADFLADRMTVPSVFTFSGQIGAGKTTLIRALLRRLGVKSAIKSPTFSLVESYECISSDFSQTMEIGVPFVAHHFDLYRIVDATELEYIGFRDYFEDQALCCIEWPEQAYGHILGEDVHFSIETWNEGRRVHMDARTPEGQSLVNALRAFS